MFRPHTGRKEPGGEWGSDGLCVRRLGLGAGFKDQEGVPSNQSQELLWEAVRGKCGQEAGGGVALCLGTLGKVFEWARGPWQFRPKVDWVTPRLETGLRI